MKMDLHLHTTFSDGILPPLRLLSLAHTNGVGILSITDHDCLDAYPLIEEKAKSCKMTLVSGVELNTDYQGEEVHILGYDFDPSLHFFQEQLANQRREREIRLKSMFDKLNGLGFGLDEKRLQALAGKGSVGRPHLALALIEKGVVKTVEEAFNKYLGQGKPGWVPRHYFTPEEAIGLIQKAHGIAVLAHPFRGGVELLQSLVSAGLMGLEVYYPKHSSSQMEQLATLARKYGLFMTSGSDFHGINPGETGPGSVFAPQEVIDNFTRILEKRGHAPITEI